jgi:hypothetical protein
MSAWQAWRHEAGAAIRAILHSPDEFAEAPIDERAQRNDRAQCVVAAGMGLLVLGLAVGTYLSVLGTLGPLVGDSPADMGPAPPTPAARYAPGVAESALVRAPETGAPSTSRPVRTRMTSVAPPTTRTTPAPSLPTASPSTSTSTSPGQTPTPTPSPAGSQTPGPTAAPNSAPA